MIQRFLNDIVKPWDELNLLLAQRYALQPEVSDVTRLAGGLAVAIRHQVDLAGWSDNAAIAASFHHRLVADAADFWKHGSLRKVDRNNELNASALFEYSPGKGFCFLRNGLFIAHATLGEHDFMVTTLAAINFWIKARGLPITWSGQVKLADPAFHQSAFLKFDPRYCISLSSVRTRFFVRDQQGMLVPVDPPEVQIEIF
ncbi:hypothetical protein TUMEXPCC7403_23060 [Tumidithrix helvetica PCC 7403]|uniref:hypothetical protein n=1 Tax=Tumidithrix helvetica TaxID=3457545 RepID=UPI003C91166F